MIKVLAGAVLAVFTIQLSAQEPRTLRKSIVVLGDDTAKAEERIVKAELAPDGKLAACTRADGRVTLFSLPDARPLFITDATDPRGTVSIGAPAFSADGSLVAFPGKGRRVEIVSARTGKPHTSCELPGAHPSDVDALAFSPDGKRLAVSAGVLYHKDLFVFDTATGKLLGQPLHDVDGLAYQLVFSPEGKLLVANHWQFIFLVDAATSKLVKKLPARAPCVFFQGNQLCVLQEASGTVHEVTVDGIAKKSLGQFLPKLENVQALRAAIAGNSPHAAIPQNAEVTVRDPSGRERFRIIGEDSPIRRLSLSADGTTLLILRDSARGEVFRLE